MSPAQPKRERSLVERVEQAKTHADPDVRALAEAVSILLAGARALDLPPKP